MTPVFLVFHDAADGRIITEFTRYGAVSTFFLPNQVEGSVYMRQARAPSYSGVRIDLYDDYATLSAYYNSKKQPTILTGNKVIQIPFSTSAHQKSIILREQDQILSSAGRWSLEWYRMDLNSHLIKPPTSNSRYLAEPDKREEWAEHNSSTTPGRNDKIVKASDQIENSVAFMIENALDEVSDFKNKSSFSNILRDFSSPAVQAASNQTRSASDHLYEGHNFESDKEEKKNTQAVVVKQLALDQARVKQEVDEAITKSTDRSDEEKKNMLETIVKKVADNQAGAKLELDHAGAESIAKYYEAKKKAMSETIAKTLAGDQARAVSILRSDKKRPIQGAAVEKLADDNARVNQQLDQNRADKKYSAGKHERKETPEISKERLTLPDTKIVQTFENAAMKSKSNLDFQRIEEAPELIECSESISQPVVNDQLSNEVLVITAAIQNNIASQDEQEVNNLATNTCPSGDLNYDANLEQTHSEPTASEGIEAQISIFSGDHNPQSIYSCEVNLFKSFQDDSGDSKAFADVSQTAFRTSKPIKHFLELDENENDGMILVKKSEAAAQDETSDFGSIKLMKRRRRLNEIENDSKSFVKKIKQIINHGEAFNIQSRAVQPTIARLDELPPFTTNVEIKAEQLTDINEHSYFGSLNFFDVPRPPMVDMPHLDFDTMDAHPREVRCRKTEETLLGDSSANNNLQIRSTTLSSSANSTLPGVLKPIVIFSTTTSKVARNQKIINSYKRLGGLVVADICKANMFCVGNTSLKKTAKLILAVALGKDIVTDKWFEDAFKHGRFPDPQQYLPKDSIHEKKWHFDLAQVIDRGKFGLTLLNGFDVYFTLQIQDELAELKHDLKQIALTLGAGRVAMKLPQDIADGRNVVIIGSTNNDRQAWRAVRLKRKIYNKDLLSMAALRGKLELDSQEFVIETPIKEEE